MPRAAPTRSTQSSSQQTGSSRGKKKASQRAENASSEEDAEYSQDDEEAVAPSQAAKRGKNAGSGISAATLAPADVQKRANDLVRLALFLEPKRTTIKREMINEKVLGGANSRVYNLVFETAQTTLRSTFGMELVELMSRTERDAVADGAGVEVAGKKKAGTKTYIVRSTLDPELIKLANAEDDELMRTELRDLPEEDVAARSRVQGRILAWKSNDDVNLYGILQLILCLILVGGRAISDGLLRRQLKSFNLASTTFLEVGAFNMNKRLSLEDQLVLLIKQNYLDRVKVTAPGLAGASQAPAPTQASRRKSRAGDDDDQLTYQWKWGTRAHAEITEQSVAEFMVDFMVERFIIERQMEEEDEHEERDRTVISPEIKAKANKYSQAIMKDIIRAAGGSLTGAAAEA